MMRLGLSKLQYAMGQPIGLNPVQVSEPLPQEIVQPRPEDLNLAAASQGMSRLEARKKLADQDKDYAKHADIIRICSIPCYRGMDEVEREIFNRRHIQAAAYESGFRFLEKQAEAISAYELLGGLFAPMGVGTGKTLTCQTVASIATAKGIQRILLLIPSSVVYQFMHTDMKTARTRINVNYPVHCLAGTSDNMRKALAQSGKKGVYVFPYSLLSGKSAFEILESIAPELIIADEAHRLANFTAARSRRVREFVTKFRPKMVALSGTITKKTLMEYHHIQLWCLDDKSPLPISTTLAEEWAMLIDAEAGRGEGGPTPGTTGPLLPIIEWGQRHFPELKITEDLAGFRRAFQARFTSAPGVVATGDAGIGTSLRIKNNPIADHEAAPGWNDLKILSDKVEREWTTPNGDVIDHQIHLWKWLYEILGAGFYNELVWPTPEVLAARRQISTDEAAKIVEDAKLHHKAGQAYMGAPEAGLRWWLQNKSRPGIDTPLLVGNDMYNNGAKNVGKDLYELWQTWRMLDFKDRPLRDARAVRVCDFKIRAAAEWALSEVPKNKGAILWVYHNEVGNWLLEYLRQYTDRVLHCPAGARYNQMILDPANEDKLVIASIKAHGEGKNLQAFQEQYFVQWPRPCADAEQTLGRLHRTGQKADELIVNLNLTTEFDFMVFAATLNDALYVHQTTGNRQKLIYADYMHPRPMIFPSAVLRQRGFENEMLSPEQQRLLDEKFAE